MNDQISNLLCVLSVPALFTVVLVYYARVGMIEANAQWRLQRRQKYCADPGILS